MFIYRYIYTINRYNVYIYTLDIHFLMTMVITSNIVHSRSYESVGWVWFLLTVVMCLLNRLSDQKLPRCHANDPQADQSTLASCIGNANSFSSSCSPIYHWLKLEHKILSLEYLRYIPQSTWMFPDQPMAWISGLKHLPVMCLCSVCPVALQNPRQTRTTETRWPVLLLANCSIAASGLVVEVLHTHGARYLSLDQIKLISRSHWSLGTVC